MRAKSPRGRPASHRAIQRRRLTFDILEDRRLLAAAPVEPVYNDLVSVAVVGRSVFYNHSAFDGNNTAANAADDGAIATDKSALLPGGTATFANYTSYSRGINGLMVDMAGLPSTTLTAADFDFRIGNVNDTSSWTSAPAPSSITIRPGAGAGGSARVEIIWPDSAIQNKWLQVTVKATPDTGLNAADVFYYGNAVGESGNSAANAIVDAADQQGAHNNPRTQLNPAPITFAYDYNRDTLVDTTDEALATSNSTTAATALKLIAPVVPTEAPATQRMPLSLFEAGDANFPAVNNPAMVTTKAGTVLAFAEARLTNQDSTGFAIAMRRSMDGGVTWSSPQAAYEILQQATYIGNPAPVVDQVTGTIFLVFNRNNSAVLVISSTDDGLTWSQPTDITSAVKVTAGGNPGPPGAFPNTPWGWYAVGPGHGIQLQKGAHTGRLLIGADHRTTADTSGISWSHVIYSDDHGQTWHLGGGLDQTNSQNDYSNEATLVELSNGDVFMSSRVQVGGLSRGASRSTDGGITWSTMQFQVDLTSPPVEGSLLRLNDNVILFVSPSSTGTTDLARHELTIWISTDDAQHWTTRRVVFFGYAGYSDMTLVGPDTVLVSFARGFQGGSSMFDPTVSFGEVGLVRINLRELQDTSPYEFSWYFNEKAPGQSASITGPSIQDYGPYDQRAWAFAYTFGGALQYVAGPAGDSALELAANGSKLILSQAYDTALQIGPNDSFTAQITMRTTDTSGVIIGTRPEIRNWTLQLVDGKVQLSLFDTKTTVAITSDITINDGQWHRVAVVRDASARQLRIYIDGIQRGSFVTDTATYQRQAGDPADPIEPVVLGGYNTGNNQLALDVDSLRFTRAALVPAAFLPANFVNPTPPPPPTVASNAPTSIPGLQFWLSAYDPSKFFGDYGTFANPLPLTPFNGMATRSMIDASPNALSVQSDNQFRQVVYASDATVGPYWMHVTAGSESSLIVHNLTGANQKAFDFVQDTGVFTLAAFVKVTGETGDNMTMMDTNTASTSLPGFSLMRTTTGNVKLIITNGTAGTSRFEQEIPGTTLQIGQWFQVAVVGTGPGNPVKFYVTPASALNVTPITSTNVLYGANGDFGTTSSHELYLAGRSGTGAAPFNGGMVNETIFDTALSTAQIQQLFQFGKGLTSSTPWKNPAQAVDVNGDGTVTALDALQVINQLILTSGGPLSAPSGGNSPPPFIDTNGDNALSALDALLVINFLIENPSGVAAASVAVSQTNAVALTDSTDLSAVASALDAASAPNASPSIELSPQQTNATGAVFIPGNPTSDSTTTQAFASLMQAPSGGSAFQRRETSSHSGASSDFAIETLAADALFQQIGE